MKTNGTTYTSLAMSNSSSSEENLLTTTRRPTRRPRRLRGRGRRHQMPDLEATISYHKKARWIAAATIFSFFILTWLVALTWLVLTLRAEEFVLHADIASVAASYHSIPAALQEIHTALTSIRAEQSTISANLQSVNSTLHNVTLIIPKLDARILGLESRPHENSASAGLPEAVASLGAELRDLKASFTKLQAAQNQAEERTRVLNSTIALLNSSHLQPYTPPPLPTSTPDPRIHSLEEDLRKLNASINSRLKSVDSDIRNVLSNVDQLGEERANLSSRVASLAAQVAQQQLHLASAPASATVLPDSDRRLRKLSDLFANLSQNVTSAFNDTAQLSSELSQLKRQVAALSVNYDHNASFKDDFEQQLNDSGEHSSS